MISVKKRSYQKELLDGSNIPFEDIARNMQELDAINSRLGGHKVTLSGISSFADSSAGQTLNILEIGSGGGDNLRAIKTWAARNGRKVTLSGVDINPACTAYAASLPGNNGIRFITADFRELEMETLPDVIFSSLFCHHFNKEELVEMMEWMRDHSRHGFFINDLHRHWLAYYSIKLITRIFSRSYLVKNDAPLSVLRGFKKSDWLEIFDAAGIGHFSLEWKWAFRWLAIVKNDGKEASF